jgi:hypothetical protein
MSTHDIRDKLDGINAATAHMLIGFPDAGTMHHKRLGVRNIFDSLLKNNITQ